MWLSSSTSSRTKRPPINEEHPETGALFLPSYHAATPLPLMVSMERGSLRASGWQVPNLLASKREPNLPTVLNRRGLSAVDWFFAVCSRTTTPMGPRRSTRRTRVLPEANARACSSQEPRSSSPSWVQGLNARRCATIALSPAGERVTIAGLLIFESIKTAENQLIEWRPRQCLWPDRIA